MDIKDRILEYHQNPTKFIADDNPLTDEQISIPILGQILEQDQDSWFIRHNGSYILYCVKRGHSQTTGLANLELMLAETWGRYTRKRMAPEIDMGIEA